MPTVCAAIKVLQGLHGPRIFCMRVKTQHFTETPYKPIISAMEIHELWWPNLDMVVHEMSLPKWLDLTGLLMKHCILRSWRSMVLHERHLVAMEVHERFRLDGS